MLLDNSRPEVQAQGLALLSGPEFPEQVRYLWDWHRELRMGVVEMLTWADLRAWQNGTEMEPREEQALFYLDAVYRNPVEAK